MSATIGSATGNNAPSDGRPDNGYANAGLGDVAVYGYRGADFGARPREIKPRCDICGWIFERPSAIPTHTREHPDQKPHKCQMCGKGSSTNSNLLRHEKRYHGAHRGSPPPPEINEDDGPNDYRRGGKLPDFPSGKNFTASTGLTPMIHPHADPANSALDWSNPTPYQPASPPRTYYCTTIRSNFGNLDPPKRQTTEVSSMKDLSREDSSMTDNSGESPIRNNWWSYHDYFEDFDRLAGALAPHMLSIVMDRLIHGQLHPSQRNRYSQDPPLDAATKFLYDLANSGSVELRDAFIECLRNRRLGHFVKKPREIPITVANRGRISTSSASTF